jgi:hypothetical protein
MKKLILILAVISNISLFAQNPEPSNCTGKYLGQKEPGMKAELFAPGLVSVGEGVHGNVVFTPDFTEAAWHPNYTINGKSLIFIMIYRDGKWNSPREFFPKDRCNYSEPFYSYDGRRLYYLSGNIGESGQTENEKIWFVERKGEGWSEPKLLSQVLPAFHWQFSLDRNQNVYFGGSSADKKAEIYYSKFENDEYLTPVRLPETINSSSAEFSPFISPDDTYLVFTRLIEQQNGPPQMNLYVSFRDKDGNWMESQNLTEKLDLQVQTPLIMMSAARVTPDGKYLFFTFFNGEGHMVYWVDAKIINEIRPKE